MRDRLITDDGRVIEASEVADMAPATSSHEHVVHPGPLEDIECWACRGRTAMAREFGEGA